MRWAVIAEIAERKSADSGFGRFYPLTSKSD